jgi:hypothetical protein
MAKTNREQSLVVHALFGKRNLINTPAAGNNPDPKPLPLVRALAA